MVNPRVPSDEIVVLSLAPAWDLIDEEGWDLIEEFRPRPTLEHSGPARRRWSLKRKILHRLLTIWKEILIISKEVLGPLLPIWNKIFVILCVFAVLMDPLFLYIPIIKEDMKCLELDKKLKKIALALRSVTDLFYIVDIMFQIYQLNVTSKISINGARFRLERVKSAKKVLLSCILIDISAVLPIPQVVLLIISLPKMRGSLTFTRMLLNSLILFQYMPRVLRIYLSGNTPTIQTRMGILVKAVFNFFPFILAGHIFGGIWYFFAIQRETTCWEYASCRSENGCEYGTFGCNNNALRNITLLNNLCPVNPPNATLFDFGIFVGAVQSDMLRSTNFSKKLFQCFWWGLRNLSSLGQNLEPGSNQWENIFAVFIFLSGMMLFLIYLSATLQTLSVRLEQIRSDELICRRKMQLISPEIDLWLSRNDLPKDLKMVSGQKERDLRMVIIENVQQKLQENKDVDVENILAVLPLRHRRGIMTLLRLASLRKVSILEPMDEKVLKAISEHLKLETYTQGSYIIPHGEPLEKMLFITQGTAWTYPLSHNDGSTSSSSNTKWLEKGDFYGEELLIWALKSTPSFELPISSRILKSQTKVEAFSIRAKDLKTVVAKFWWHFKEGLGHLEDFQLEHWKRLAVSSVQANWRHYRARAKNRELRNWRSQNIKIN